MKLQPPSSFPSQPHTIFSRDNRKDAFRKALHIRGKLKCSRTNLGNERCTDDALPQNNPRSTAIRAVAKANELDLEIVEVDTTKPSAEYLKLNKLGKVPTFEGDDGYVLYESMAIAIYSRFNSLPRLRKFPCYVMINPSNLYSYPCLNQFRVDILYLIAFTVIHQCITLLHKDCS